MLKLPRVTGLLRGGAGCQQLCLLLSHIFHHPRPRGRPVFSPLTPHGPSPGPPPASQALTLLKRYPHASIACEPHPRSPTFPKTRSNTHSHTQTRNIHPHTWERVASWKETPWNTQLLGGPEPRAMPLPQRQPQFPHFPQHCFSPSPLHLSLRGSCTIPWELQMWPRIAHSVEGTTHPEGLSHPQVYPTQTDSQLQSHQPRTGHLQCPCLLPD